MKYTCMIDSTSLYWSWPHTPPPHTPNSPSAQPLYSRAVNTDRHNIYLFLCKIYIYMIEYTVYDRFYTAIREGYTLTELRLPRQNWNTLVNLPRQNFVPLTKKITDCSQVSETYIDLPRQFKDTRQCTEAELWLMLHPGSVFLLQIGGLYCSMSCKGTVSTIRDANRSQQEHCSEWKDPLTLRRRQNITGGEIKSKPGSLRRPAIRSLYHSAKL